MSKYEKSRANAVQEIARSIDHVTAKMMHPGRVTAVLNDVAKDIALRLEKLKQQGESE